MFKSILTLNETLEGLRFSIIDDDFTTIIAVKRCLTSEFQYRGAKLNALINCYKLRGLNVAANLLAFFNYSIINYSNIGNNNLNYQLKIMQECIPEEYEKYKDDLEKYILLT